MSEKAGWKGRFYEDFEVGDMYRHPLGRTVTQTDNIWFTLLTQNTAPFIRRTLRRTDGVQEAAGGFDVHGRTGDWTECDRRIQNVFANLGWDEVRLPNPVFEGDTIYSQSEVRKNANPGHGLTSVSSP